jgi:hypothetical protein
MLRLGRRVQLKRKKKDNAVTTRIPSTMDGVDFEKVLSSYHTSGASDDWTRTALGGILKWGHWCGCLVIVLTSGSKRETAETPTDYRLRSLASQHWQTCFSTKSKCLWSSVDKLSHNA